MQRISNGDEQAFETFVTHYGPQLELAIYRVVKSNLPVGDIMQDVFLSIWLAREKLETLDSPRTWLFRMAYYRSYTWLQKQAVRGKAHRRIADDSVDYGNSVEDNSAFEETRKFVYEAIELLPPRTKMIYSLSRNQNLSIDDIARQLKLSPQTVKNTLSSALKSIRGYLEDREILLPAVIIYISF